VQGRRLCTDKTTSLHKGIRHAPINNNEFSHMRSLCMRDISGKISVAQSTVFFGQ
jgi:hypothetical protein